MPKFETVRRVPHSAEKMFSIVADVESYPQFLKLCDDLKIIDRQQSGEQQIILADMTVGYKALSETFRSRVVIDEKARTIETENIKGPFKYMRNSWRFEPALSSEHSDIHFTIDYAFKNWALEKLMGGMFRDAFNSYSKSFEERANSL